MPYKILKADWETLARVATDTAGRGRAGLVLRALEGRVWRDLGTERSSLHFNEPHDPRPFRIEKMVFGRCACPYVMIHEFGHAYHCYYWPIQSAMMEPPCVEAEAVALLFEHELQEYAARHYIYNPPRDKPFLTYLATSTWQKRRRDHEEIRKAIPDAFDKMEQVVHDGGRNADFHTLVERLVNGG